MVDIYDIRDKAISILSPVISIELPQILDAYFAQIRKEGGKKKTTVKSGEGLAKLAKRLSTTQENLKKMNAGKLKTWGSVQGFNAGEKITYQESNGGDKVYFDRIKSASIGEEVYLVVETQFFQNKKININILQGKEKIIADIDKPIEVIQNGSSVQKIECTVGEFDEINNAKNKGDFKDWAIAKITLKPSNETKLKEWEDAIEESEKALFYLLVDAHSPNPEYDKLLIVYHGHTKDEANSEHENIMNYWLDVEEKWFEMNVNKKVTIRLTRKWQTTVSTIGEFSIDNSDITGFILEEKGPSTTTSGLERRIPTGTYNLVWHNGTRFKNVLKLYNSEVPQWRAILIHAGNSAKNTEGCLLPGGSRKKDWVSGSQAKLKEINDYVNKVGIEDATIIITESYEDN